MENIQISKPDHEYNPYTEGINESIIFKGTN